MIAELAPCIALAALTSWLVCRLLIGAGLVDAPHLPRHQHKKPTPTSGGIGIAAGYCLGLLAVVGLVLLSQPILLLEISVRRLTYATVFAFVFFAVGFVDDARPLSPGLKFLIFTLASLAASLTVATARQFPISPNASVDLGLAGGLLGSALWIFTLVNCTNFMDGANGLALGSIAIGFGGLAVIAFEGGSQSAAIISVCAVGAILGFLVWNFPNGKLFAGDSGALFCGALAAMASLAAVVRLSLSPFIPAMLFFPILADALITLAWRFSRRRNLLDGHSEHLYQIALRGGWSHARVALHYWTATLVCGVIAYLCYRIFADAPLTTPLAFAGLVALALIISYLVRRYALTRGIAEI